MESGRVPPAVLLPELLTDLDEAQTRLSGAPDALRAPMARVCGLLSALAAINVVNAGDVREARRYWRTALRAVAQGGDRRAQAWVYATRARFALWETSPSPGITLEYADEAIRVAGGTACAGAAYGYGARAMALAVLGDHEGSAAAVRDDGEVMARLPEAEAVTRTPFGVWEQQLYAVQSRVYAYAGRSADAAKAQAAGVALVPPDCPVPLADFELTSAMALISAGDPSEGARHVVRTINALPPGYRHSAVVRQSAAHALGLVPVAAANVPAVAEARELLALPPAAGA
jgi:hypothetical protein